jgi:hypothetical protein
MFGRNYMYVNLGESFFLHSMKKSQSDRKCRRPQSSFAVAPAGSR